MLPPMGQVKQAVGAGLALLVALVGTQAAGAAPLRFPEWNFQTSTNRGGDSNVLNDVSCATTGFCVAVGAYRDFALPPTKPSGTLIETYSAGKWTTKASPGQGGPSRLNGVSCPTTTRCYAVGESHSSTGPLIVTSTGGGWSTVAPPAGADPGDLQDVDCVDNTHCVAVGTRSPNGNGPLVLVLDGGAWSVATLPSVGNGLLYDVSCASATQCVAVGYREGTGGVPRTLALHRSGSIWTKVTVPNRTNNDNRLYGVSCPTATKCEAVGSYVTVAGPRRNLRATWSAGVWNVPPGYNPGSTFAIDCTAASTCASVGDSDGHMIIDQWWSGSGGMSSIWSTPGTLLGIDCVTRSVCVAVGGQNTQNPFQARTIVLRSRLGASGPPNTPSAASSPR